MYVGDDFDNAVEMVEGDDRVKKHKERLWDFEDIFHRSRSLRLEIMDAIIANVADRSSCERW